MVGVAMKRFLLIAVVSIAVLRADPTPALTWTSDAVFIAGGGFAGSTPTGIDVGFSCLGCGLNFLAARPFTVTSPGTFVLSTVISLDGESTNCRIFAFCAPSAVFSAALDGDTSVETGDIFSFGGPSQHFTDSGSDTVDCGPDAQCLASLFLEDHRSNSIALGLGNYFLEEDYTVSGGGLDPFLRFDIQASLVPTPEPRGGIIIVAGALLMVAVLNRARGHWINAKTNPLN
jgi:hypothetical protein